VPAGGGGGSGGEEDTAPSPFHGGGGAWPEPVCREKERLVVVVDAPPLARGPAWPASVEEGIDVYYVSVCVNKYVYTTILRTKGSTKYVKAKKNCFTHPSLAMHRQIGEEEKKSSGERK